MGSGVEAHECLCAIVIQFMRTSVCVHVRLYARVFMCVRIYAHERFRVVMRTRVYAQENLCAREERLSLRDMHVSSFLNKGAARRVSSGSVHIRCTAHAVSYPQSVRRNDRGVRAPGKYTRTVYGTCQNAPHMHNNKAECNGALEWLSDETENVPIYQKTAEVDGKLLPYPSTATDTNLRPPFVTPEGPVTQWITCVGRHVVRENNLCYT
jgi:hypothetical protein